MPDLTAAQLHKLMQPLWERELELKSKSLQWVPIPPDSYLTNRWTAHWCCDGYPCSVESATQLCESQILRWLAAQGWRVVVYGGPNSWIVDVMKDSHADELSFSGHTLVQALATACTAVLDAKAEEPT